MDEKFLISKEDMKTVGGKLVFKNKLYEAVDDSALALFNKFVLNKIAEKLPEDILPVVQDALKAAIEMMPEVEI